MHHLQGKSAILLFIIMAAFGLVVGLWALAAADERFKPEITAIESAPDSLIAVGIEGPITNPGIYRLPKGARVVDLIEIAGGETDQAKLASVNLARILSDGEVVAIPGAAVAASTSVSDDSNVETGLGLVFADARVNINTATVEELDGLPGIGPVLAEAIIAERDRIGGFSDVDDLAEIAGISPRMVDEFRHLVSV